MGYVRIWCHFVVYFSEWAMFIFGAILLCIFSEWAMFIFGAILLCISVNGLCLYLVPFCCVFQ